jgi:hypothetical protein
LACVIHVASGHIVEDPIGSQRMVRIFARRVLTSAPAMGLRSRVCASKFKGRNLRYRVWAFCFAARGSGFRVKGSGFKVQGLLVYV